MKKLLLYTLALIVAALLPFAFTGKNKNRVLGFFGDADACYALGVEARFKEDYPTAIKYFSLAANQNHLSSQSALAVLYLHTSGVPENLELGLYWARRAAEQGDYESQWQLGKLYLIGKGAPHDAAEAYKWFLISSKDPFHMEFSSKYLLALETKLDSSTLAEGKRRALEFLAHPRK